MSKNVKYFTALIDEQSGQLIIKGYDTSITIRRLIKKFFGKSLIVSIEIANEDRTSKQNRYYWGVIIPVVQAFLKETQGENISKEEIHTFHLTSFADHKVKTSEVRLFDSKSGRIKTYELTGIISKSSKKMTIQEFTYFVEKIKDFWSEKDCVIPDPIGNVTLSDYVNE